MTTKTVLRHRNQRFKMAAMCTRWGVLGTMAMGVPLQATQFARPIDGSIASTMVPKVMAGALPDTPANRVDPNSTSSPFGGVGSLYVLNQSHTSAARGSGVAISPYHILTAAHNFDWNGDGLSDVFADDVTFNLNFGANYSSQITGASISIHPQWTGFQNPSLNDDLAILRLNSALPVDVPIYSLYGAPFTTIQLITMVGYGLSGNGDTGFSVSSSDTVKRVGYNLAEVYSLDDEGSGSRELFWFDFDGPSGNGTWGGGTIGNSYESTIGPGDSGGPSFVYEDGRYQVFGINTFGTTDNGKFGGLGGGMVVSAYQDWIVASIPDGGSTILLLALAAGTFSFGRTFRQRRD